MSDYHEMAAGYTGTDHHEYRIRVWNARKSIRSMIALQHARIEAAQREYDTGQMPLVTSERITQHATGYIEGLRKALEMVRI